MINEVEIKIRKLKKRKCVQSVFFDTKGTLNISSRDIETLPYVIVCLKTSKLIYKCIVSPKKDLGKQCRLGQEAAERGFCSESTHFA